MWSKYILALVIMFLINGCARRKFNTRLLIENSNRIALNENIKYYDKDDGAFYLLTFYKQSVKVSGEDFTFEGVTTYKDNLKNFDAIVSDIAVVQYLALYFFENGGVVYHTKYTVAQDEKYVSLAINSMEELYEKDQIRKRDNKTEYIVYQPIMQGYQFNKVDSQNIVKPIDIQANTPIEPLYANKEQEYNRQAFAESLDSSRTYKRPGLLRTTTRSQRAGIDTTYVKVYLERGADESPIYLIGKHLPQNREHKEAILIEQIYYQKEVGSAGVNFMPALISETFDLGNTTEGTNTFKPLFWFRLENKKTFAGNTPNRKR